MPYETVYGADFEDPPHRLPDIGKLRQSIGFEPRYTLEQSLEELIRLERQTVVVEGKASP